MSLSLFNEFRPLFRLLDDPFLNPLDNHVSRRSNPHQGTNFFSALRQPAVDVSEEGHKYVIEAELPGVKKENINVYVGDNGRSITIEGRDFAKSSQEADSGQPTSAEATQGDKVAASNETAVQKSSQSRSNLISSERVSRSQFTRTVWLPRAVDGTKVSAKLVDGILTLDVPKMEDKETVKVNIQ
ncbi:hypothetical protein FRC03_002378 [Tulasnella sp. 419]|nr:hypothetical protein FRC02_008661 [Tulasnella sp. 418]KAG8969517.1 hypothetical protein FRC03_002378 [Tulasnella sp. 419]